MPTNLETLALRFEPLAQEFAGDFASTRPVVVFAEELDLVGNLPARTYAPSLAAGNDNGIELRLPNEKKLLLPDSARRTSPINEIIIIIDVSGSMNVPLSMSTGQTKLDYFKSRLLALPDNYFPADSHITVIAFSNDASIIASGSFTDTKNSIQNLKTLASTDYSQALTLAIDQLKAKQVQVQPESRNLIIFLTDGNDNVSKNTTEQQLLALRNLNTAVFMAGIGVNYSLSRVVQLAGLAGNSSWGTATGNNQPDSLDLFTGLIPALIKEVQGAENYLKLNVDGSMQGLSLATPQFRRAIQPSHLAVHGYSTQAISVLFERRDNLNLNIDSGRYFLDRDTFRQRVDIVDAATNPQHFEYIKRGQRAYMQALLWDAVLENDEKRLEALKDILPDDMQKQVEIIIDEMQAGATADQGNADLFTSLTNIGASARHQLDIDDPMRGTALGFTGATEQSVVDLYRSSQNEITLHSGNLGHIDASVSSALLPPAINPDAGRYRKVESQFSPKLVNIYSGEIDLKFILNVNDILIGRAPNCHVRFENSLISRQHAVITYKEGKLFITDLDSRNGTFLNDEPLVRGQETELQQDDLIRFSPEGSLTYRVSF